MGIPEYKVFVHITDKRVQNYYFFLALLEDASFE